MLFNQSANLDLHRLIQSDILKIFALCLIALIALLLGLGAGYFVVLWTEWGAILGGLALSASVFLFPPSRQQLQELRVVLLVAGFALAGAGISDLLNFPQSNSDVFSGFLIGFTCGVLLGRIIWRSGYALVRSRVSTLLSRNGLLVSFLLAMLGFVLFPITGWLEAFGLSTKICEILASVGAVLLQLLHLKQNGSRMIRSAVWITSTFMLLFLLIAILDIAAMTEMSDEFSIGLLLVSFAFVSLLARKWTRCQKQNTADTSTPFRKLLRQMGELVLLGVVLLPLIYIYMQAFVSLKFNLSPTELVAYNNVIKLSDEKFINLMMRDVYYWKPKVNIAMAKGDTPALFIESIANDRWSFASTLSESDNWEAGFEVGRGLMLMKQLGKFVATYVGHDSPAGKAGFERGDQFIVRDKDVADGKKKQWLVLKPSGDVVPVNIPVARYKADTVIFKIIKQGGKNLGYLWLLDFNNAASPLVIDAFHEFKQQGVDEIVLDLRYNGGGHFDNLLPGLIAGTRFKGNVYAATRHSEKYRDKDDIELLSDMPESIPVKRLFVLTTQDTCSASELIINGLRPYLPVITIGEKTCGKPFFMDTIVYDGYVYNPVTGRLSNAEGKSDYEQGIEPNCMVMEDFSKPVGQAGDPLLEAALYFQKYNNCPAIAL